MGKRLENIHVGGPSCTICNPPDRKVELTEDDPLFKAISEAMKKLKAESERKAGT